MNGGGNNNMRLYPNYNQSLSASTFYNVYQNSNGVPSIIYSAENANAFYNNYVAVTSYGWDPVGKITIYNQYANEYETIDLDDLDIEVLSLLMQEKEISDFYSDNKFVSHQISVGRYWCRTYLFYDLSGKLLPTLTYNGFAFREFAFAFGSDVRNSNTKKGAACLLEKC